jgi:hypothetical protein
MYSPTPEQEESLSEPKCRGKLQHCAVMWPEVGTGSQQGRPVPRMTLESLCEARLGMKEHQGSQEKRGSWVRSLRRKQRL